MASIECDKNIVGSDRKGAWKACGECKEEVAKNGVQCEALEIG